MSDNVNKQRLLKNTVYLYIRQIFTLLVSLYTSRLTLSILGVSDFGVYAAVGGVTAMLSIITSSLSSSGQRYMSIELGRNNREKLGKVFNAFAQIQFSIGFVFLLLAETLGYWFVANKLVIPAERMTVAVYVFHISIISCVVSILNAPYNALLVAHENMSWIAVLSITEAVVRLALVYSLTFISYDKLLFYALFLLFVQILYRIISLVYCRVKYPESKMVMHFERPLYFQMLKFASWNMLSNGAILCFIQGANILINLFFGPIVNGAYTVAYQAYSGIRSFCSSFQLASNPQIIKSYTSKDLSEMHTLIFFVCKISFFLIFLFSLPFLLKADYIMHLWLKEVPEHTTYFFILMLIYAYCDVLAYPLDISAQATDKIKNYCIVISIVVIMILPITYILYNVGMVPESIYYVAICVSFASIIIRLAMLRKLISINILNFMRKVLIPAVQVSLLSLVIPLFISRYFGNNLISFVLFASIVYVQTAAIIFFLGINRQERAKCVDIVKKRLNIK